MTDLATLQQHQLLTRLLSLSRRQNAALHADRIDDFLALMDEREQIVEELIVLEEAPPAPHVLPFPTLMPGSTDHDVKAALRGLITSILQQDEENEQVLRQQMDGLRSTMMQLNRGALAARGYAATMDYHADRLGLDRAC